MSVCRWVVSTRYDPMRLCYGWWAASYKENSRCNLRRSMTYVRRQCGFYTGFLRGTRQPLGRSPNHAHATEDNTPCWGESAVATRVITTRVVTPRLCMHSPPNRTTTCTRAGGVIEFRHEWLQLGVVPHTAGLRHVVVPHTTVATPSWYTLLSPRFVP